MVDGPSLYRECLRIMLRPLAQYCIRHSIGVQEILEDLKITLLSVAQAKLEGSGDELNVSRLTAMTGVHRRDVRRICKHQDENTEPQSPISKIIGRWLTDPNFRRRDGRPKVLTVSEERNELAELVALVCSDLHHGTVLTELERLGAIERSPKGIRLLRSTYVARSNTKEGYRFLAEDMRDLISAADRNLSEKLEVPNLHITTIFDKISNASIPAIRQWLLEQGTSLHEKVRDFLAQHDCDTNKELSSKEGVSRVVLGTFSLTEDKKSPRKG